MSKFVEAFRLRELAEEAIDFARRDQALIPSVHTKKAGRGRCRRPRNNRRLARTFEKPYRKVNRAFRKEQLMPVRAIRLIDRILAAFHLAGKPPE